MTPIDFSGMCRNVQACAGMILSKTGDGRSINEVKDRSIVKGEEQTNERQCKTT